MELVVRLLTFSLLLALPIAACSADQPPAGSDFAPLKFVARLPAGASKECSGIVRSRKNPDLFWTLNDSGDEPRLYPVHRNGSLYVPMAKRRFSGVLIEGAKNVDWEDLAVLDDGTLVIADLGNNDNDRRDLALYFVEEPSPTAERSAAARRIEVRYPDQSEFPPPKNNGNFDCEAIFSVGQTVFVLAKHRSDRKTTLYRLDDPRPERVNTLTLLGEHDIDGMVTAADCDASGKQLLVLTYQKIWLFERDNLETPFFAARVSSRSIFLPQAEAICFADEKTLLLADELTGTLFELPLSELHAP